MKIIMELREEQGGKEAKLLVSMMADIYQKSAINQEINAQIVEQKDGFSKL